MNYKKIYDQIIENAKIRQLTGYKEKHHIIPRCIGGLDTKDNLVELTAREHFVCHQLLCEIYTDNKKLKYALWAMSNQNSSKQQRVYSISSRLYESLRKEIAEFNRINSTGRKHKPESIQSMIEKRTGQKKSKYKNKESKFVHICECCDNQYKSADIKGRFCIKCKEPRACKCGCSVMVKTPGRLFARGCQTRGKSYIDIYGTKKPNCGFKKGNRFGKV